MGRVYRTEKEWEVIRKNRKAQHSRLEEIAKSLGFVHVKAMMLKMGLQRPYPDMHYRAGKGERDYTSKFIELMKKHFPQINLQYFMTGEGPVLSAQHQVPAPVMHIVSEPAATYAAISSEFFVRDDTMADFFKRGDMLQTRDVDKNDVKQYGEPHVVFTSFGTFVRYLWPAADGFVLKSHNPSKVPDMEVPIASVTRLSKVVRLERPFE